MCAWHGDTQPWNVDAEPVPVHAGDFLDPLLWNTVPNQLSLSAKSRFVSFQWHPQGGGGVGGAARDPVWNIPSKALSPLSLAELLTRATQPGLVSPGGGD